MISNQETLNLSPFMAIYDKIVPKDNMLRQINKLVDFTFILEELKTKYCLDNGRSALEKKIIKSKSIIVDATHTKARYIQKSPKKFLQENQKTFEKQFINWTNP